MAARDPLPELQAPWAVELRIRNSMPLEEQRLVQRISFKARGGVQQNGSAEKALAHRSAGGTLYGSSDSGIAEEGEQSIGEFVRRFFWNEMAALEVFAANVGGPLLPHFQNSRAAIRPATCAPQREQRSRDLPACSAIGLI